MDKHLARINRLTLQRNHMMNEYNKRQKQMVAIRERVIGRFVIQGLGNDPSRIQRLKIGELTLDAFVTKVKEREALALVPLPKANPESEVAPQSDASQQSDANSRDDQDDEDDRETDENQR
jgi:hypothetical protein